jgi:hypothetical protein
MIIRPIENGPSAKAGIPVEIYMLIEQNYLDVVIVFFSKLKGEQGSVVLTILENQLIKKSKSK